MKIIVFPLRDNPYQKYLYDHLAAHFTVNDVIFFDDINIERRALFVKDVLYWPFKLAKVRDKQKIFHIHWQFFYFLWNKKIRTLPSILLAYWILGWVKALGFKIIWTVHDYNQHDINQDLDNKVRNILISMSSHLIVLNSFTKQNLVKNDHVPESKISVIPIGNYGYDSEYHQPPKSRDIHFLFFGLVRKYKGVERLIHVFRSIAMKNIRLVISGDPYNRWYGDKLKKMCAGDSRITFQSEYLDDAQLNTLIHKSDVVVLPFLEVTNSSSAVLAYSKGRPVIAPRIGSFNDDPDKIGFFYKQNNEQELKKSILKAAKEKEKFSIMGRAALKYAKSLDWSKIAKHTYQVYQEVAQHDP